MHFKLAIYHFKLCIQISRTTGETFARNANAVFMETSAKEGTNVRELFKTIGIFTKCFFACCYKLMTVTIVL